MTQGTAHDALCADCGHPFDLYHPAVIALLVPSATALGLLLAVRATAAKSSDSVAAVPLAYADLLWCGVSLYAKPRLLYAEMSGRYSMPAPWLELSVVALLLSALLLLPSRVRPWASWLVTALLTLGVWGQVLHWRFFGDVMSGSAALFAGQISELGDVVVFLSRWRDALLALDLVVALPLVLATSLQAEPPGWRSRVTRGIAAVLATALMPGVFSLGRTAFTEAVTPVNLQTQRAVARYGLYGFQLLDLTQIVRRRLHQRSVEPQDIDRLTTWFERSAPTRRGEGAAFGVASGKNLLLIQVEALQQFVVDYQVGGQQVMPNLMRLLPRALSFTAVQDQTSKGRSSAGDFVNMTSLLPVGDSVAYQYPRNHYTTIAHALQQRGYATISAIPFRPGFWNRYLTHPAYGFDTNLFQQAFEPGRRIGWGLNDRDFLRQMLPRLQALPRPFVAWLTTLSLHYPYREFPDELERLDLGPWEGTPLGNYLQAMNFFDRAFGEFYEGLRHAGLLEDTVIALWGDHGSGLQRDDETLAQLGVRKRPIDKFLFDKVPLLNWVPGPEGPRGTLDTPAGQVDVAPTLLALMGVDPAPFAFMGRNLLGAPGRGPIVHPLGRWLDQEHAFLPAVGDRGGSCWDVRTRQQVAKNRCEEETREATRRLEISGKMLVYDLQQMISERLEKRLGARAAPNENEAPGGLR
ncbi:MAG: LTA synthase family protein [Acidobacteriota bacterium]